MTRFFEDEYNAAVGAAPNDRKLNNLHTLVFFSQQLKLWGKACPSPEAPNCDLCGVRLPEVDTLEVRGPRLRARGICSGDCLSLMLQFAPGGSDILGKFVRIAGRDRDMRGRYVRIADGMDVHFSEVAVAVRVDQQPAPTLPPLPVRRS